MRHVKQKLGLIYKNKLKLMPGKIFERKIEEANTMPEYGQVVQIINDINGEIPSLLDRLEDYGRESVYLDFSSYKESDPIKTLVSYLSRLMY